MNPIKSYLYRKDWRLKENANRIFAWGGLKSFISEREISNFALREIYPKELSELHRDGSFHIHDLSSLVGYCAGHSLQTLLLEGFNGVGSTVQSKPAKHFRSALGQLMNFLGVLQQEWAGAQAVNSFDTLLAPYVYADHLTLSEVKQSIQEFVYNINVPLRFGMEVPFTNISWDLVPPADLKDQYVIWDGKVGLDKYSDFQDEMNLINKAFLEVMYEGDAHGNPFPFPIPTYRITKRFSFDGEVGEALSKLTAKFGSPYFENLIGSNLEEGNSRSMCPLDGEEKVLIRSTRGRGFEYSKIKNLKSCNHKIYSDGKFVEGRFDKYQNQRMIKVELCNGHELIMSDHHLNFVMKDRETKMEEIIGKDLTEGMYLPYSLNVYNGSGGNEDLGYFVGAYAGDGSFNGDTSVVFSLNTDHKENVVKRLIDISEKYFGAHCSITKDKDTKLLSLTVHSRAAVGLCKDFVSGMKREKCYNANIFGMSKEFRMAVLQGHNETDGSYTEDNDICTSSKKMVETINMLSSTLGTTTTVFKRDNVTTFNTEPRTIYGIRILKLKNDQYGDHWFKKDNKLWMKINSIKQESHKRTAYCFDIIDDDPMFTVGTTGILTHNCHLKLDLNELRKKTGGIFGSGDCTGSLQVVTINLNRIGLMANCEEEFFHVLDYMLERAREVLQIKRKYVNEIFELGLMPYTKRYLPSFDNHFSTVGIVGGNECCLNFLGEDISSVGGKNLMIETLKHIRDKLEVFQREDNVLYNLEESPSESCCFRLAKLDIEHCKKFQYDTSLGVTDGLKTSPFLNNSTHLPVDETEDVWEALRHQEELQQYYTGGTVFHTLIGSYIPPKIIESLVTKISTNSKVPYFTITPTFSICPKCQWISGEHETCPTCGSPCQIYSRVVGYYRPVSAWNDGKAQEFKQRKMYKI